MEEVEEGRREKEKGVMPNPNQLTEFHNMLQNQSNIEREKDEEFFSQNPPLMTYLRKRIDKDEKDREYGVWDFEDKLGVCWKSYSGYHIREMVYYDKGLVEILYGVILTLKHRGEEKKEKKEKEEEESDTFLATE